MEELTKTMIQITEEIREISGILKARNRELDRREEFEQEMEDERRNIRARRGS